MHWALSPAAPLPMLARARASSPSFWSTRARWSSPSNRSTPCVSASKPICPACAHSLAQAIPLPDASLDALVCAQAFHWFASREVLDEFHRVLRPGGRLGLVWDARDESVDWVAALTEIITPYEGNAPRFHKGDWRLPFPHPGFGPLTELRLPHQHTGTPQNVVIDRFMSISFIALPAAENAQVRAQLESLLATHPALRGRETLSFPSGTLAVHCLGA